MSYNGIGLSTPRGSGTSGYVQKNVADKKSEGIREKRQREALELQRRIVKAKVAEARRNAGEEVRLHDKRRQIEIKCMELREELEDKETDEESIEREVKLLRKSLLGDPTASLDVVKANEQSSESTQLNVDKFSLGKLDESGKKKTIELEDRSDKLETPQNEQQKEQSNKKWSKEEAIQHPQKLEQSKENSGSEKELTKSGRSNDHTEDIPQIYKYVPRYSKR